MSQFNPINSANENKASECDSSALLIYDWDDTILPTSWLRTHGYLSNNIADMIDSPCPFIPQPVLALMSDIEELSIRLLESSKQYGRVVIITNSSCLWIPFTAKRFFPKLSLLLESGYEVYSARPRQAEEAGPNYVYLPSMAITWKTDRFREIAENTSYSTFVSIGDGFAERCAVLALRSHTSSAKAVRFMLQPTGQVVLDELRILEGTLTDMVRDSRSGDYYLHREAQSESYRVVSMSALTNENHVPTTNTPLKVEVSVKGHMAASNNPNSGIMAALATGLAYCGRSLTRLSGTAARKMSLAAPVEAAENPSVQPTTEEGGIVEEKLSSETVVTMI